MVRLATSRPHEFLCERNELFSPRSGQASDEVARGPEPYYSDDGLFWMSNSWSMVLLTCHANRRRLGKNNWIFKSDLYRTKAEKWVFLGVAETIVDSLLCCGGSNVQCLFNLLYYIIWLLHRSTTPRNYQKIGLMVEVAWWSLFAGVCKAIPKLRFSIRPLVTNIELTSEFFTKMSCNENKNNGTFCSIILPCC